MTAESRLALRPLTSVEAERVLAGSGQLTFAEGYPSTFATEVLRLVAAFPPEPIGERAGTGSRSADPLTVSAFGPWVVVRRSDDTVVGTVSCARMADVSAVTVGYEVAPSCQGRGYATEALRLVVEHLLAQPGVQRVCADTTAEHTASRRVMEKAGLRRQRDQADAVDGREAIGLVHYAIGRTADA